MLSFDHFVTFAKLKLIYKCLLNQARQVRLRRVAPRGMWNSLTAELKFDPDWDHLKLRLKQFLKNDQLCTHE